MFDPTGGGDALRAAIEDVRNRVSIAIALGSNVIILSDRNSNARMAPIPSLLLTAAVHEHLVREKSRTRVGLVVESGDAREVHHIALLIGYGASAVNPYLAFETIDDVIAHKNLLEGASPRQARTNYIKAACKGVIKIMSKMGVSTVASYTGAQIFEAVGLAPEIVDEYFTGTVSRIGGVGLDVLAQEVAARHRLAHLPRPTERAHRELEVGGEYQWRREGEIHLFNPRTVFKLQHATRAKRYDIFKEYTKLVDDQATQLATLRGLLRLREGLQPALVGGRGRAGVRDREALRHGGDVLRVDLGRGARDAGHRHEPPGREVQHRRGRARTPSATSPTTNGDLRRSAIKQVASARFGVTSEYLVNADDLQIKIAQGAKPGEGGQLMGNKVYPWIAKTRFTTPGVGLISPPPHHDIYSIEDIAQLIHDLKSANPKARVHVKLVAEVGVGTVAAGVAKAKSDVVLISGHDGGTGASPLTSIKHAGIPWELGLAETQQTLILNGLRDRIVVQVDGQLKTGRDVIIAALLGAEEFGFATAPLGGVGVRDDARAAISTPARWGSPPRTPSCASASAGSPSSWRTSSSSSPRRSASTWPRSDWRRSRRRWGASTCSTPWWRPSHFKAKGPRPDPHPGPARGRAPPPGRSCRQAQDHGLDRALDHRFLEACRPAIEDGTAGRSRAPHHQRGPHGGDAARLRDHVAPRGSGASRRDHHPHLPGLGGPELRRLRPARRDAAAHR